MIIRDFEVTNWSTERDGKTVAEVEAGDLKVIIIKKEVPKIGPIIRHR